jgi:hypothetical protein
MSRIPSNCRLWPIPRWESLQKFSVTELGQNNGLASNFVVLVNQTRPPTPRIPDAAIPLPLPPNEQEVCRMPHRNLVCCRNS